MISLLGITASWLENECHASSETAERIGTADHGVAASKAELARHSDPAMAGTGCRGHSPRCRRNGFASDRGVLDRTDGVLGARHRVRHRKFCGGLPETRTSGVRY